MEEMAYFDCTNLLIAIAFLILWIAAYVRRPDLKPFLALALTQVIPTALWFFLASFSLRATPYPDFLSGFWRIDLGVDFAQVLTLIWLVVALGKKRRKTTEGIQAERPNINLDHISGSR